MTKKWEPFKKAFLDLLYGYDKGSIENEVHKPSAREYDGAQYEAKFTSLLRR